MATAIHGSWFAGLVRLMPAAMRNALDAWSYRIAMERADRRRNAGKKAIVPAPTDYQVRPWRD
ncbi:MAG: hypothetical protein V4684_08460 [Pseudomonadota bacterium]